MGFSLKKVFKRIGKIVSAPVRGLGHALRTSHIPIVSNVGGGLEHAGNAIAGKGAFLREIGKAGKSVAPVAALVPGVGPLAAGALGAGGELLDRGRRAKLTDVIGEGALPAAEAYLLGGQGFRGLSGVPGRLGALAKSKAGKFVIGEAGKLGSFVTNHPLEAAQIGLAGLNTVQSSQRAAEGDRLRRAALDGIAINPDTFDFPGLPGGDSPYGGSYTGTPNRARRAALASLGY